MRPPEILNRYDLPPLLQVAEVKKYLRVYDTEHDSVIMVLIDAAIEFIQTYTRQTFRKTQYRWQTTEQPLKIPRFPVISVDLLEYTDTDGNWAEVAAEDLAEYEITLDTPPLFRGDSLNAPLRITWTAGLAASVAEATNEDWPMDLIVLVWQVVEENFVHHTPTPANAQAIHFSNSFKLAIEQYSTHHDAIR